MSAARTPEPGAFAAGWSARVGMLREAATGPLEVNRPSRVAKTLAENGGCLWLVLGGWRVC